MMLHIRKKRSNFNLRMRFAVVVTTLLLCSGTLVARAAYIQLIHSDFYQRQGKARYLRNIPIATTRGVITDRNNEPLAVSTPVMSVWANPQEVPRDATDLNSLASMLQIPKAELQQKLLQNGGKEFIYLKRRIDPDVAVSVVARKIPGIYTQGEYRRFYPQGEALAHVLGYTNIDDHGQEGAELEFDRRLRGVPGSEQVVRDAHGHIVESIDLVHSAVAGKTINLSIDRRIQFLAYKALDAAIKENNAAGGSVVIMDVHNGEIISMVNLPTYNPNAVENADPSLRRNRAVTDLVEPGSTMKPLTVATALSIGVITKDTLFDTNPGYMTLGKYTIRDVPKNNGILDVGGIITRSSNVGAAKIVQRVPDQTFYNFIRRFGYGTVTGSGFPGEAEGVVLSPSRWSGTSKITMSYGYGLSVSALQIARAFAALGNGGSLVTPTFIKGQFHIPQRILSPHITHEVIQMMEHVITEGGAKQAAIPGYLVAGKTGTARMIGPHGYMKGHYNALFVGLVPASAPRFVAVVVINDPQSRFYYGGLVAAPVFHTIMEGALRLMHVPMDDIPSLLAHQFAIDHAHPSLFSSQHVARIFPSPADEISAGLPATPARHDGKGVLR